MTQKMEEDSGKWIDWRLYFVVTAMLLLKKLEKKVNKKDMGYGNSIEIALNNIEMSSAL